MSETHIGYVSRACVALGLLLGACTPTPKPLGIADQIKSLPSASTETIFGDGGKTMFNMTALLKAFTTYCEQTRCDPNDLLGRTTFIDGPDPSKLHKMVTDPTTNPSRMTIYNYPIDKCNVMHEAAHLEATSRSAPKELGGVLGIPGDIRFDGFAMTALSIDKNKGSLTGLEEATADAIALGVGQTSGERCDVGYGDSGYLILAVAEKKGISFNDLVTLHKTSDLIGFLVKLTGSNDLATNFNFFMKFYSLVEEVKSGKITLEQAIKQFETFDKLGKKGSSKRGEFVQYLGEHGSSLEMMFTTYDYTHNFDETSRDLAHTNLPVPVERQKINAVAGTLIFPPPKGQGRLFNKPGNHQRLNIDHSKRHKPKEHRRGQQN